MTQTERRRVHALLVGMGSGAAAIIAVMVAGAFIGGEHREAASIPATKTVTRTIVHTIYCTPGPEDSSAPFRCDWDYWSAE